MSSVFERFEIGANGHTPPALGDDVGNMFPLLCELMAGKFNEVSGRCEVPKFKITVWREGAKFKTCLGGGRAFKRHFMTHSSLEALCESLELALAKGAGEWDEPRPSSRS